MPGKMIENSRLRAFIQGHIVGEYDNKNQEDIAASLGVSAATLRRWNRRVDWEHIKTERRKHYAVHMCAIDAAMVRQASKGDVNAAKLMFERFDGWIPTQARVSITDAKDDQLKQRADQIKAEFIARDIAQRETTERGVGQDLPRTGEARA